MKTAELKDRELAQQIARHIGDQFPDLARYAWQDAARTLRRAQMTLHRWAEEECNGTIQRDETTGKPRRYWDRYNGASRGSMPIPDREAGALRRVAQVCKEAGLHYYHQTDPRGCALYVSTEPLNDQNYSRGIACL